MATQALRPHHGGPRPHRGREAKKQRSRSPRPADADKGATLKQGASSPPLRPPPPKSSVEVYAGSGFWKSPAPSSLPLPSFAALKQDAPAVGEYLATVALRRMLRLE